ncbi:MULTISPECIES: nucleoside triphosphate pyrophosphohydrolase [Bacillus]|uniref:nucleoside triphosphate pyrophosphohydrolase n=1 Tax=Bacillus TaxID=1386 RepID=UPI00158236D0|nr:nucleoside triphosphate pyrophosphohydrolase [Bacillus glycinifermentans]MBU8788623.1 nucleoside triphosphate pyrophosphohydrolase [Bacillus glycinifermentans]NUJ18918.1 nucleoside triphosphate pyrophosphohydrolase [Bacillus glycinifermentans]
MAGKITVIGLGAGDMNQLTLGVYKRLTRAETLYVRTKDHPLIEELKNEIPKIHFFDDVYEKHDQFEEVYEEIAEALFREAQHQDVLYAVPGHPFVAEKTVQLLLDKQHLHQVEVAVEGGHSFLDATFNALKIDPIEGFQFVDAVGFSADEIELRHHLIICQVYDQMTASEVKLTLMEKLPVDYEVVIVTAAGSSMEEIRRVPLYELDRSVGITNLTSVYVPPVKDEALLYQEFSAFRRVIRELRGPEGCPWDRKQTHQSLKKYLIEECYEVLEAIDEDDPDHLAEELGDVLLQVLLHAQIGEDDGLFTIDDVIFGITEKMIRRHPHVFGDISVRNEADVMANWEEIKKQEKQEVEKSILDGIPKPLPALSRANQLQKKAAKVGFDWSDVKDMWNKVNEEMKEFSFEVSEAESHSEKMKEEFGDLLFALVNIGRYYKIEPEEALAMTNSKFYRRFTYIEQSAKRSDKDLESMTLEEMDELWNKAKDMERG